MSNARSPRDVCSMTVGMSGTGTSPLSNGRYRNRHLISRIHGGCRILPYFRGFARFGRESEPLVVRLDHDDAVVANLARDDRSRERRLELALDRPLERTRAVDR